ncbi:MAG: hypothetical protein PHX21_01400 [bacterium]|nr:hypothetical protein [bacterium]
MKWSRVMIVVGSIFMILGIVDPLEGSLLILPASGMVLFGTFLDKNRRSLFRYWRFIFIMIAVGVGALFGWSAVGGFGPGAHSWWWGLTVLPYPIGWILGFANIISGSVEFLKRKTATKRDK